LGWKLTAHLLLVQVTVTCHTTNCATHVTKTSKHNGVRSGTVKAIMLQNYLVLFLRTRGSGGEQYASMIAYLRSDCALGAGGGHGLSIDFQLRTDGSTIAFVIRLRAHCPPITFNCYGGYGAVRDSVPLCATAWLRLLRCVSGRS
jgi:hypothetical protein